MSLEWIAVFFIFVVLNTALSYRAGRKEGQFLGMVDLAIFLQDKSLLKDKNNVLGYESLPNIVKMLLENPKQSKEEAH
tara:strand:- start:127 stop:360 length:234 start_codon:yes stop_codon:yes gene_type:complete